MADVKVAHEGTCWCSRKGFAAQNGVNMWYCLICKSNPPFVTISFVQLFNSDFKPSIQANLICFCMLLWRCHNKKRVECSFTMLVWLSGAKLAAEHKLQSYSRSLFSPKSTTPFLIPVELTKRNGQSLHSVVWLNWLSACQLEPLSHYSDSFQSAHLWVGRDWHI